MAEKRKIYQRKNGELVEQLIASSADIVEITGTIGGQEVTNVKEALEAVDGRYSTILNGLNGKVSANTINQPNGVAGLDANGDISTNVLPDSVVITGTDGKIPSSKLPSYVDDIIEGYYKDNKFYTSPGETTLISGETGKIYVDMYTNKTYRFASSQTGYVEISASLALGETSSTAYPGDKGAANAENIEEIINEGRWYLIEGTISGEVGSEVVQLDKTYSDIVEALNEIKIPVLSIANNIDNYHYYFIYSNRDDDQNFTFQCDNNFIRLRIYVYTDSTAEFVSGYNIYSLSDSGENFGGPIISKISNSSGIVSVTRRAMADTDLPNSGVTAGTYSAVAVDAKGRVTAGNQLVEWGTDGQTTPSDSLAIGGLFFMKV